MKEFLRYYYQMIMNYKTDEPILHPKLQFMRESNQVRPWINQWKTGRLNGRTFLAGNSGHRSAPNFRQKISALFSIAPKI